MHPQHDPLLLLTMSLFLLVVFDRYGDPEVCQHPLRWRADEDFARWLYAPAEYCKPPFVDTVQEAPHRAE